VFVAGWGLLSLSQKNCSTGDMGPQQRKNCKFPFRYQGHVFRDVINGSPCVFTFTPSQRDKRCARARDSTDLARRMMTKCYPVVC